MSLIMSTPGAKRRVQNKVIVPAPAVSGRYLRMYITNNNGGNILVVVELKYYDMAGVVIDTFTNRVAASSGSAAPITTNVPSRAFDLSNTLQWAINVTAGGMSVPAWLKYDMGSTVTISKIRLTGQYTGGGQATFSVKDFVIQASPDNVSWTDVGLPITGQTAWGVAEEREFILQ